MNIIREAHEKILNFTLCKFITFCIQTHRKITSKSNLSLTHDNESLIEVADFPEVDSTNFFEYDNRMNIMPHWLCDDDLKNSETETLPAAEEQFWIDLIETYLEPIEPTTEEKVCLLFFY